MPTTKHSAVPPDSSRTKAGSSRYGKCMYFASGALARKIEKIAMRAWAPVGLSPSHAYLLMIVIDEPGVQPSDLVEELLLTPSTITRLMEKLGRETAGDANP